MSLIEVLRGGGYYWRRERLDSPGHSIAIPNGTPFKIATAGPASHDYISGVVENGFFAIREGELAGRRFKSAHEAVNTVREPSSNAFLFISFFLDGGWTVAEDYRRNPSSALDEAEEQALRSARDVLRDHPKLVGKSEPELNIVAARYVADKPQMMQMAREQVENYRALPPDEINLELPRSQPIAVAAHPGRVRERRGPIARRYAGRHLRRAKRGHADYQPPALNSLGWAASICSLISAKAFQRRARATLMS
ncbi:MAG TPA: hypothetical protein VJY39_19190 [Acidisphaera sp.]|nr:hypothetical protein [Acidisphaera sp.]HME20904.1 hypothetical protein [Acetobacteraceae bacterium]